MYQIRRKVRKKTLQSFPNGNCSDHLITASELFEGGYILRIRGQLQPSNIWWFITNTI